MPRKDTQVEDTIAALTVVGEEGGPAAAAFLGGLLAASARSLEWTFERLYEGEKADHERTKERLRAAEDQLALIRHRQLFMFGAVDTLNPEVWG